MSLQNVGNLLLGGLAVYLILSTINRGRRETRRGFKRMNTQYAALRAKVGELRTEVNAAAERVESQLAELRRKITDDDATPEEIAQDMDSIQTDIDTLKRLGSVEDPEEEEGDDSGDDDELEDEDGLPTEETV